MRPGEPQGKLFSEKKGGEIIEEGMGREKNTIKKGLLEKWGEK